MSPASFGCTRGLLDTIGPRHRSMFASSTGSSERGMIGHGTTRFRYPGSSAEERCMSAEDVCAGFPSRRKALRFARQLGLSQHGAHAHFPPLDITTAHLGVSAALAGPRGAASSLQTRALVDFVFILAARLNDGCSDLLCPARTHLRCAAMTPSLVIVVPKESTVTREALLQAITTHGGSELR